MSKLRLYGSTSGYNEITVPAVADNSEINVAGLASNTYVQSIASIPSGTKQLFVQTAAPTGWTKDTTHNNKAMRVVSGTAGSGGSDTFTSTFGPGKTTANHTLTESEMPAHVHPIDIRQNGTGSGGRVGGTSLTGVTGPVNSLSTGGSGAHSHNLSGFDLQYVDVIIATKD